MLAMWLSVAGSAIGCAWLVFSGPSEKRLAADEAAVAASHEAAHLGIWYGV